MTVRHSPAVVRMTIEPATPGERDRLWGVVSDLALADPTLRVGRVPETHQIVIDGVGLAHLERTCEVVERGHGITLRTGQPTVLYRSGLKHPRHVHARHVSAGAGPREYAIARVRFTANGEADTLHFVSTIAADSELGRFIPAVRRGIEDAMLRAGVTARPYCGIAAEFYDGESHDPDSTAAAFEAAGRLAFGLACADNVIQLEPIMHFHVELPEATVGDVIGDLSRRGLVRELVRLPGGMCRIDGQIPMAGMMDFAPAFLALTAGRGSFQLEFAGFVRSPPRSPPDSAEPAFLA